VTLDSLNADETVRALVRHNISFNDLEVTGAALEEAFVALTERGSPSSGSPSSGSPSSGSPSSGSPSSGSPSDRADAT
jgi:hypothetical protein